MKKVLFAGAAFAMLATSALAVAATAPATAPAAGPAAAPHRAPDVTFAQVKAEADKLWDRLDANHDGKIDSADRDVRLLERFAKWDTNHDGVISKDEFLAFVHAREAEGRGHPRGGPDGGPEGGPEHGWARRPGEGPMGMHGGRAVAMAIVGPALHEARKDGVITRAAFDAALKARFDKLDTNHDGKLTHEELRAARHAWGREGRGREGRGHEGWGHHDDRDMPPPPGDK